MTTENCEFCGTKENCNNYKLGVKDSIEIINKIENPYPEDIFPKVELSEFQSHTINDFLCSHLRITLDGLSAEISRRARKNLIDEIKLTIMGEQQ